MLSFLRRFYVASTVSNYYLGAHILFGGVGVLLMDYFGLSHSVIWQVVFDLTIGWEIIELVYYVYKYDNWWQEYGNKFNAIADAIGDCYWVYFVTWIILS